MRTAWERDGGRCWICGEQTEAPSHHLLYGPDKTAANDWNNPDAIMTLCIKCHVFAHKVGRRIILAQLKARRFIVALFDKPFPFNRVLEYYERKYSN